MALLSSRSVVFVLGILICVKSVEILPGPEAHLLDHEEATAAVAVDSCEDGSMFKGECTVCGGSVIQYNACGCPTNATYPTCPLDCDETPITCGGSNPTAGIPEVP